MDNRGINLEFLGCGHQDLIPWYGNNSAFFKNHTKDGTNMCLFDCGGRNANRIIKKARVLDNVRRLFVGISHAHPDHFDGLDQLLDECNTRNILTGIIQVPFSGQQKDIMNALTNFGLKRRRLVLVRGHEIAPLMGIHDMEFDLLEHDPRAQTTAFIMKNKNPITGKITETTFAADHCDSRFIRRQVENRQTELVYTDCTGNDGRTTHFSFNKLCRLVPPQFRQKFVLMCMTRKVPQTGKAAGFLTADQFYCDPQVCYKENDVYKMAKIRAGNMSAVDAAPIQKLPQPHFPTEFARSN